MSATTDTKNDPSSDAELTDTMDDCDENEPSTTDVRGRGKSGRFWKNVQEKPSQKMKRDKPFKSSWSKKLEAKQKLAIVKSISQEIKDEKQKKRLAMKEKRLETEKRRLENARKSEVVQVIRNTRKLKKIKKKQLRKIEKRDIALPQ